MPILNEKYMYICTGYSANITIKHLIMNRFLLFKNGKVIGDFINECSARLRFLKVCQSSDFKKDVVYLQDLENDGEIIANY